MRIVDLNTWNRKQHYQHFSALADPYFAVTLPFDVSKAYAFAKTNGISFFGKYLHDCMKAINTVENLRYRIIDDQIIEYDVIHTSATLIRADKTYGFSFITFDEDLDVFIQNLEKEKQRIQNSTELYPLNDGLDCIYCSALPWLNFSGHKETFSGKKESVPRLAFSKMNNINNKLNMNVAISVNHALVDGYHVGLFADRFQEYLNN